MRNIIFIIIICILFKNFDLNADEKKNINIAVASNFLPVLNLIIKEFKKNYNYNFNINSDSTSNLFLKINNGAKFDIFLSADSKHINLLKIKKENTYIYAYGKIAILIKNHTKLKKNTLKYIFIKKKFFISNFKLSPYGLASLNYIKNLKIKNVNIYYGLNINQTYNYINILNNSFGIIAYSQMLLNEKTNSTYKIIPKYCYNNIKQKIAIINKNNKEAFLFFEYIKTKKIKNLIEECGYKIYKYD